MSNLTDYLSYRDPRTQGYHDFICKLKDDIPKFEMSDVRVTKPDINSHLIGEMEIIFNDDNRYSVECSGNFWDKNFDNFYLKKLSTYRMVQEWMAHPIGLSAEVWMASKSFKCPECHKSNLTLSGGSNAAWADLHCQECKNVFVELKTKSSKAIRRIIRQKNMSAGSYRWFKAQENEGIRHYIVLLPKDGGNIYQCKIRRASATVDGKLCAYLKGAPGKATLRTSIDLGSPKIIGKSDRVTMSTVENQGAVVVKDWIAVKFGHYARKIQRLYKRVYK